MTSKRSKDQIILKILETCQKSASKTGILYGAGLNFNTVKPYLLLLTEKGMLETVEGLPVLYRITLRGLAALEHISAQKKPRVKIGASGSCFLLRIHGHHIAPVVC